jgi:hypothetical protein
MTPSGPLPWWLELLGRILAWGIWILLGLLLLTLVAVAVYFLVQWLLSRTSLNPEKRLPRYTIFLWLEKLRLFLHSLWIRLARSIKGCKGAVQFYTALLAWGRRSGLPHFRSETPTEYELRLTRRFPSLGKDIAMIVDTFNREVYGGIVSDETRLGAARSAWFRLRNPRYWPGRLKTWFLRPQEQEDSFAR